MSRNVGLLWIMAVAVALMATPVAVAQDVTGGMVTDPQVYDDMKDLLRDLKKNPWKLMWRE